MRAAVAVLAVGARDGVVAPLAGAAAADQQPLGRRVDVGEFRLAAAQRAARLAPVAELEIAAAALRRSAPGTAASPAAAPDRAVPSPACAGRSCAAPGAIAASYQLRDDRFDLAVARQRLDAVVFGRLERLEPPQDVGRLPDHQPEVGPVDRNVLELQHGPALLAVGLAAIEGDRRQRHARLNAPLGAQQLDLHVGGRGQVGLVVLQLAQLDDFAGLGRRRSRRGRRRSAGGSVLGRSRQDCDSAVVADAIVSIDAVQSRDFDERLDPDGRLRSAAVFQDGRAGRRAGRAAAGAGQARPSRHARHAEVSRCRRRTGSTRHHSRAARRSDADTTVIEQPLAEGVRAVLVDRPELYDRESIYGAGSDYPDNPRRFGFLCRAALEYALQSRRVVRRAARARLAGRPRAGVPPDALRRRAAPQRDGVGLHHSQSGLSGHVPARLAGAARSRPRAAVDGRARVLGPDQLPEGRHQFSDIITTVSPTYAQGNPDRRSTAPGSRACWRPAPRICTAC